MRILIHFYETLRSFGSFASSLESFKPLLVSVPKMRIFKDAQLSFLLTAGSTNCVKTRYLY